MTTSSSEHELYAVRLLFEAQHPDEPGRSQLFEDRILILRGRDQADAERRARDSASTERVEYQNEFGGRVVWEFIEILDVKPLVENTLHDGMEAYYSLLDAASVRALRRALRVQPHRSSL